jgi:hypothetical protein
MVKRLGDEGKRRMRLIAGSVVVVLLLAGCTLRPRYADFINAKTEGAVATFVIVDADRSIPIAGAKIEIGELKNRVNVTSGADGTFTLPVDKKYSDENSIFSVTLPRGLAHYKILLAPQEAPSVPEVLDAGEPASNG